MISWEAFLRGGRLELPVQIVNLGGTHDGDFVPLKRV